MVDLVALHCIHRKKYFDPLLRFKMPSLLLLTQLVLPIMLLLWLLLAPLRSLTAFSLQAFSTAIVLATIALVAPWAMPPWWTPILYGAAFLLIVSGHALLRRRNPHRTKTQPNEILVLLPLIILAFFGSHQSWNAMVGHQLPQGEFVDVRSPFLRGHFIIENAGATRQVNGHLHAADPLDPLHDVAFGQSRAIDIIPINRFGFRSSSFWPSDPEEYYGFGYPVVAPCDGLILEVVDGRNDQDVPRQDITTPSGNKVVIQCSGFRIVLAHLKSGSVVVETGNAVVSGDIIGQVGNSGASTEPHLHIHAKRLSTFGSGSSFRPLWLLIDGQFLARNDRVQAH
ncbi:M23 family metallopeptidase [Sedimentitalea todarodis]|uniref:M23 family metallopeptidase n=1 Tax=Sedimentitalea todarodis TaxID=1631240 RepID=A0ABU3VL53_9RHOB|nr:M23 family metallopeptidase [Sedimentitalea todarodis]MDU9006912.1 M23 family metallopeptidase [Sedimentitalea todarodis]